MNSILITGCNRGLGLGLVKALLSLPKQPRYVFATCRNLEQADELKKLAANNNNLHLFEIDLRHSDKYEKLVNEISELTKENGLNVLFNNAGISPKSTRITATKEEDLMSTFHTNTVVPIMLAKAFLPLLKQASNANSDAPMGVKKAAIINMSSILGSIAENTSGGLYAYRTSKAALNMATKSLSADLYQHKIMCVCLHPGWVQTDMGGSNAPLTIDPTMKTLVDTLFTFTESHNGGFYQYDGQALKW